MDCRGMREAMLTAMDGDGEVKAVLCLREGIRMESRGALAHSFTKAEKVRHQICESERKKARRQAMNSTAIW